MSRTYILGADPGVLGGLCLMRLRSGRIRSLVKMPIHTIEKASKRKTKSTKSKGKGVMNLIDYLGIQEWLDKNTTPDDEIIFAIEDIGCQPMFGGHANWGMSASKHLLLGLAAGRRSRICLIKATEWQQIMFGVKRGKANKARSVAMARQLFPKMVGLLQLKGCDGLAESLLIAEAVRRKFNGYTI